MAVTQNQIAIEAKVSRSTVAAVMSPAQSERISPEVRRRVLAVAERLGYRPNRYAQVMSGGRSGLIGLISFGSSPHLAQIKMKLATKMLIEAKYEIIAHDAYWFPATEMDIGKALCQRMLDARVEGVMLFYPNDRLPQKYVDTLLQMGIPIVSIAGEHLRKVPSFISDREWGYYQLTRHLLESGRRNLVFLASHGKQAEKGFNRAIQEYGGKLDGAEILHPRNFMPNDGPEEELPYLLGKAGLSMALSMGLKPDALLCSNDAWAIGALAACAEAGIKVPEELAVTGFDNDPAARFGSIPITTIDHPSEEIAKHAVNRLLSLIRTGEKQSGTKTEIQGKLLIRQSCGSLLHSHA